MLTHAPSEEETLAGGPDGVDAPPDDLAVIRSPSVGRYVIIKRIGAGAMGVVYKAFDPELDRAVAIKLLRGDGSRKGTLGRSRLQREAKAMARIAHPNVIAIHDVGTVGERVFLAMELVNGEPLGDWQKRTNPGSEEILSVFRRAGAGIAAAHAAGVVHRDFKPDNVLVDQDGRPRVLDFGLARQGADPVEDGRSPAQPETTLKFGVDLTRTGAIMGTPAYMAPEQFAGVPSDERTDQFAFCVALYEALTGARPFRADSLATLSVAVLGGERTHAAGSEALPPRVVAVLDRGLQTKPEDRFASMTALLEALSPPERSQAGVFLVGVAVLATATAAAYGLGRSDATPSTDPEPCVDAGASMDALWTQDRRNSVLSAFERSGAFNGASMGERVVNVLDEHAATWAVAAKRSCAMTEQERALTDELAHRSQRCLDKSFTAFERILEELGTVDVAEVQSSLTAVEDLPESAACNEIGWLELEVGVPLDPQLRASVAEVSEDLTAAVRTLRTGDARGCLEELAAAAPRVHELGFGPEIAKLLALRAKCELAAGEPKAAWQTRERAFEAALASADDLTALKIASTNAHELATTTDDFAMADAWVRRADALLQRHGIKRSKHIAPVLNARGILASRQDQTEAAIGFFTQMAEFSREDPAGASNYITGMSNVGVALANARRLEEATTTLRSAAEFAREHWGPRHAKTATQQTKLAQVLALQGRFEEARAVHMQALEGLRAASKGPGLTLAYSLLSLGIVERNLGNRTAAKAFLEEAYELRDQLDALDTREAAPLFTELGHLASKEDDAAVAERWYRRALNATKGAGATLRAGSLGRIAAARLEQGDRTEARALNQKAEVLALSEDPDAAGGGRASTLYTIASNWIRLDNRQRALELFEQAEREAVDASEAYRFSRHRVEYARALVVTGRNDRAREILDAALEQLATTPYPATLVKEALALRDELGLRQAP